MLETCIYDDRFKDIIDVERDIEVVESGFCFVEGPIWNSKTSELTFSDIICNTQYRWSEASGLSVFRRPSYMANGNSFDGEGRIVICEHATSRLTRSNSDGSNYEVLATHYGDKQLNSPNDVIIHSNGDIYFTDPMSGRSEGYGVPRESELGYAGAYRLDAKTRELTLLVDDFELPNGLCLSLDEKQLFVNDTRKQHIRVFDITQDGTLSNGRIWAETKGDWEGVPDGMKLDSDGNLFTTGPGGMQVFDSEGKCLGVILMPEKTANFCWGDDDLKSLYLTASSSLYKLRTKVSGKTVV